MRNVSLTTFSLSVLLSMAAGTAFAQTGVGLGTLNPDASAALDVASTSKGVLFPRVTLTSATDASTVANPAAGLTLYNTSASIGGKAQLVYNSGTSAAPNWAPLGTGNYWSLAGNSGTNAASSYVGTADSVALTLRVNNRQVAQFQPGGALWFGDKLLNQYLGDHAGFNTQSASFFGPPQGNNQFFGSYTGYSNVYGGYNQYIGAQAGYKGDGSFNQGIGYQAAYMGGGINNQSIGYQAGYSTSGTNITSGSANQFIGYQAGYNNVGGAQNQFIGYQAGFTATGYSGSFANMPTNQFIGYQAGYATTNGNQNSYIGYASGRNGTSNGNNTYVGYQSGLGVRTGSSNTFVGSGAGSNNADCGNSNTALGINAGAYSTGSHNTMLGANTSTGNYKYAVAIGSQAAATADNVMVLGGTGTAAVKVGIGVSAPTEVLQVQGNILASGTITQNSDRRLKTHVRTLTEALSSVNKLRGVRYEFLPGKGPEGEQVGVIAQEVEKVYPELVRTDATTGLKSVNYAQLTPILLEAIKSLSAELDATTARTLTLEHAQFNTSSGIEQLREHLQRLEAQIPGAAALNR
jgi:hypothetical protein